MYKILPSITTAYDSDYFGKLEEIRKFKILEFSLFLTGIGREKRLELYKELEKMPDTKIPHIHLRNDIDEEEVSYMEKRFSTEAFNIHPAKDNLYPFNHDYSKFKKKIFIENALDFPEEDELNMHAGLCLDFAHWEESIANSANPLDKDRHYRTLAESHATGCCHISAIKIKDGKTVSSHLFSELSQFDYLKKYIRYFSGVVSIELVNPIAEQLEVIKYINTLIS